MTDSMVERVARAIGEVVCRGPVEPRKGWAEAARAAIAAMRKPTHAMMEAGDWDKYQGTSESIAHITWEYMIDAALKD